MSAWSDPTFWADIETRPTSARCCRTEVVGSAQGTTQEEAQERARMCVLGLEALRALRPVARAWDTGRTPQPGDVYDVMSIVREAYPGLLSDPSEYPGPDHLGDDEYVPESAYNEEDEA